MIHPVAPSPNARRVLVIDDELAVLRVVGLLLERNGFSVDTASSAPEALELLKTRRYQVVLSDIIMPELSGVEFLREMRRYDLDVPVILMTAGPTLDSALDAISYGAQQYLLKPVEPDALVQSVGRAAALGELARLKRSALTSAAKSGIEPLPFGDRATLEAALTRAFDRITIVFQPIVSVSSRTVLGYEALTRGAEDLFATHAQVQEAAERIGWRPAFARTVLRRIGESIADLPERALLFVNMHPMDAQDGLLVGSDAPLEPIARSVVLEVSERCPADQLLAVARAAAEAGADAVSLTNTFPGIVLDWRRRRPYLGNGAGGLSGPAIKPLSLRCVWNVARAVPGLPIVGIGGVATIDDVMDYLVAGASAVQMGTVNFYDPGAAIRAIEALPGALETLGVSSAREAVGAAAGWKPQG